MTGATSTTRRRQQKVTSPSRSGFRAAERIGLRKPRQPCPPPGWSDLPSRSNWCTIVLMGDTERDIAYKDLLAEIARVCGVLNVAHAQLVALTAQAIDEDLWRGWGVRSVEHFLQWQTGLSPARAK